jgi:urease accessory protein
MKPAIMRSTFLAVLVSMAATAPALAHHPMGGQTPQTFMNGLLSGLGHPVIGLDHLAAVLGVGILAGLAARGIAPVLAFSGAVIAGVAVHLAGIGLPAGEFLVGLTTLAIGGLVIARSKLSPAVAAALFALAGLVHGHALGESIVGAESTPLAAYLAGLFIVQSAIAAIAYFATLAFLRQPSRALGVSVAGAVVAVIGAAAATAATL